MRIVVTGRNGQVVSCLAEAAAGATDIAVIPLGRPALDLADPEGIGLAIANAQPDLVVSAAAYTNVDQAEDDSTNAFRINSDGAAAVARAAERIGVPVIHLSTDYVFSGNLDRPYVETDPTGPSGVYGRSKLAGEYAVAAANPRSIVLRTSWVYSAYGKNFLKTILTLAHTQEEIRVVADQWGNPTSAHDIAFGILHVARHLQDNPGFSNWGVFHLAGAGDVNWSGFARHILNTSKMNGGPGAEIRDVSSEEYRSKVRRPANSRLDCTKLAATFDWSAPAWRSSATKLIERLLC